MSPLSIPARPLARPGLRLLSLLAAAAFPVASAHAAAEEAGKAAVPVTLGSVGKRTVTIDLKGLGTAQAWQSVTAKAQVNGYLSEIDFHEGQDVKRGDLLAMIDPRPYAAILAEAVARQHADEANLANDRLNLARDSRLASQGFQTQQQADNDAALVREYVANLDGDDAAIAAARLNLDFCRITAPVDGVVGFRLVDIGNLIESSSGTAIVSIQQIHPIAVVFTLPEQDVSDIVSKGSPGGLTVLAYTPDNKTLLDTGTLVAPNNQIETTTGTISLKAIFKNAGRKLWPGQYVQARLALRSDPDALVVADDALQHGPDGLYVYRVDDSMQAHQQAVKTGYDDGTASVVTSGLAAGDRIVLAGQSRLQDGSTVTVARTPPTRS